MSELAAPVRKKHRSLAQGVVEQVIGAIRAGTLQPGEKLPTESSIMLQHGVSRTVVREAISHLQAAGMVETRHGIGTFVLTPPSGKLHISSDTLRTLEDILAILELRICLETEAAALAATRRTPEQLAQLAQLLQDMAQQGASAAADQQFHHLVAQATGNRYFVDILGDLGNAIIPRARVDSARLAHDDPAAYLQRVQREHDDIFQAIQRQDGEGARAAMRTHLSNSRERLRAAHASASAG
jgi:GntR family transcriptional repressor for pyruvate dehydrogenase complex